MLESPVAVCSESCVVIWILWVSDILDVYGRIEVEDATRQLLCSVSIEIDGDERTIRSLAFADHSHTLVSSGVRIEIVIFCSIFSFYLYQIGSKHGVPLIVDVIGKNGTFVSPLGEVFCWGRPHAYV